jgi:hypothetical protein
MSPAREKRRPPMMNVLYGIETGFVSRRAVRMIKMIVRGRKR